MRKSQQNLENAMIRKILIASAISLFFASSVYADPINVAFGKDVTLHGTYGDLRPGSGWSDLPLADASTLTDGIFMPRSTLWNQDSIWWDTTVDGSTDNWIEIDLGTTYELVGFIVQADDNDTYQLDYWTGTTWASAWTIPVVGGWGDQTRPNPFDDSEMFMLASSITTDRLRLAGATPSDYYYSVTEIQAYGYAISEPGTLALFGIGLIGIAIARRKLKF
jgi:hypothetical protein